MTQDTPFYGGFLTTTTQVHIDEINENCWIEATHGYTEADIRSAINFAFDRGYLPIAEHECLPQLTDTGTRIYLEKVA